jgi:REP element-mobilizing transposase RayT
MIVLPQAFDSCKGTTARHVFQRFPAREEAVMGRCLLVQLYYVGSVGDMRVDAVLKYIGLGQD